LLDNGVLPTLIINDAGAGLASVFEAAFVLRCGWVVEYFFFA